MTEPSMLTWVFLWPFTWFMLCIPLCFLERPLILTKHNTYTQLICFYYVHSKFLNVRLITFVIQCVYAIFSLATSFWIQKMQTNFIFNWSKTEGRFTVKCNLMWLSHILLTVVSYNFYLQVLYTWQNCSFLMDRNDCCNALCTFPNSQSIA